MAKTESYNKWLETGYEQFAKGGPDSIQIEKLARLLVLNKSGFYHYFGDIENYYKRLVKHHEKMIERFLNDIPTCQKINPDFLNIILKHKLTILAQIQMVRNEKNILFHGAYQKQDTKAWQFIQEIWSSFINIPNNPALALMIYELVRDMFYTRITFDNFEFEYLLKLSDEIYNTVTKTLSENDRLGNKKTELN